MQRKWLVFFGLWLATTLYILLFPTRHFTPDAVNNLIFIEQQNQFELWHSQHLLAQWPGYWLYQLFGGQLRAWEAMRYAHAFLAGATVALVYAAILALTEHFVIAVISALVLWVSYGFWYFQSNPDIYAAGYAAVALLMLAYIRYLKKPTDSRLWTLGLAASLAMLTHQVNLEFAGLIGLSLIWLASRPSPTDSIHVRWKQVALYAAICIVVVAGVYVIGYLNAADALVQAGGSRPPFMGWVLGYFNKAESGQATWGISLRLDTLPLAGYTFLTSWVLPPRVGDLSIPTIILFGLLAVGVVAFLVNLALVLRKLERIPRLVAVVCIITLIANGISGWWWQAGNIKFYLFMQLHLIVLGALYAKYALSASALRRRISQAALGAAIIALVCLHIFFTLPFETQGGVFAVAQQATAPNAVVWFDTPAQADIFKYITRLIPRVLPPDFCQTPPASSADQQVWWVVSQQQAANCPALSGASQIGSFQADRTRQVWDIYRFP